MSKIPELAAACTIHARLNRRKETCTADERERRALWLRAVAKGATRTQIQEQCDVQPSLLLAELRKARAETDDPELQSVRLSHGGLTLGEYWCPETGCDRSEVNGNEPFASAQAVGMHRVKAHNYRLGKKALTASMVRKARADKSSTTRELAKRFGVSHHALGAARSFKTWRSLDAS